MMSTRKEVVIHDGCSDEKLIDSAQTLLNRLDNSHHITAVAPPVKKLEGALEAFKVAVLMAQELYEREYELLKYRVKKTLRDVMNECINCMGSEGLSNHSNLTMRLFDGQKALYPGTRRSK